MTQDKLSPNILGAVQYRHIGMNLSFTNHSLCSNQANSETDKQTIPD